MEFINTELPDIIELKDIDQSYDGGKTFVLKNFNLLIEDKPNRGQFVALLGPSGCGKSTILKYICSLQKPTSGIVNFKGRPITKKDTVGMVFQQYSSLPWKSVIENVALGLQFRGINKKDRTDQAMEAIKIVGLEGHENKYAKYGILSGGQLQRVAIARNLLTNPEILLMDEPFGALDIHTRLKMQDMLLGIFSQIQPTIVMVTHDISEAVYLSDDIYIMSANPGVIVHHIPVSCMLSRSPGIKRSKQFTDIVYDIEDKMMALKNNK